MIDVKQKNPLYFQNVTFDTNIIQLYFPLENSTEFIAERTILPALLMKTSKDYPEEDLMSRECSKNYIITMSAGLTSIGTQLFLSFTLQVPKRKLISEINLEDCIHFFQNTLLHPNAENGIFSLFEFEKKRLQMNLKNTEKDKSFFSYKRVMEELNPGGFLCNKLPFYPEKLDSLTSESVFEYYNRMIVNSTPFIFLFGDKDLEQYSLSLEEKWNFNRSIPELQLDCNDFLIHNSSVTLLEDEKPFQESILTMVYKVKDMTEEDRIPLMVLSRILSSSSTNLLMKKLRDEAKLVYHTGSSSYSHFGLLKISCGIDQRAKEESINMVKEVMNSLFDLDFLEKNLAIIKEQTAIELMRTLDEKFSIFNDFVDQFFGVEKTSVEESNIIRNLNSSVLIGLVNRLQLDLIHFLKGTDVGK